ncbi:MAG: hypothetical protein GYB65_19995, partial [Chloroflexi bacterium]|nr:hypothetical protein [Chloroflexota bacterium]
MKRLLCTMLVGSLVALFGTLPQPSRALDAARDSLLITPTTQGVFHLLETGVFLEVGYASVETPTQVTVTRQGGDGGALAISASDETGPLLRFEMPLIAVLPESPDPVVVGWPGAISPLVP